MFFDFTEFVDKIKTLENPTPLLRIKVDKVKLIMKLANFFVTCYVQGSRSREDRGTV